MDKIILSNGEIVNVPEGADPEYVRRMHEARLYREAHPRPKRKRASRSRATSRRRTLRTTIPMAVSGFEQQAEARGRALGEQVKRVNGDSQAPGESSAVLVNCGGRFYGIVEVA
jgi:hypothetical protein